MNLIRLQNTFKLKPIDGSYFLKSSIITLFESLMRILLESLFKIINKHVFRLIVFS